MGKEKKLIKDTIIYMIANFGAKILLLIIYPIYTYYILPHDLGEYDLIISTLTLFYPIVVFSINDALFRWLLDSKENEQSEIISIGMKIMFRNILIVDFFLMFLNIIFEIQYGWFILGILNFGCFFPVLQQITRGLGKNKIFAISGLIYAGMLVCCNFILIIIFNLKIEGLFLSQVVAYFVACVYLYIKDQIYKITWWKTKAENKILKRKMINYSLMLIPNSSCWWVMNAADRYFIRFFINSAANGIYSVSHKFPSILNMVTSVFSLAWQEQAIIEFDSTDRNSYFSKVYQLYYRLLFCSCLLLIPVTKWFTLFCIQKEYVISWKYSGELYLGSVFLALATFLGAGYLSAKDTKGSMTTSVVGAVVNIIFDFILIPMIGLEAAAISTLLGNISVWGMRWCQTRQYFQIEIKWIDFLTLILFNLLYIYLIRLSNLKIDATLVVVAIIIFILYNRILLIKIWRLVRNYLNKLKNNRF